MSKLKSLGKRTDYLVEKIEQESTALCAFGIACTVTALLILVIVLAVI